MRALRTHLSIILVVIFGALLRFTNLNWDDGGRLHPDEALIVNGALSIKFFSQLFPGFHDYNGLSVYFLAAASRFISSISGSVYWSQSPEGVTIIGRFLSALVGTLTIPLIYLLGKRLWKHTTGLYAAIFFTSTPLLIQLAHFYTTENILLFLLVTLLHTCVTYVQKTELFPLLCMSVITGLLLATKNTAYLFLPIPIAIIFMNKKPLGYIVLQCTLFLVASGAIFFVGSPYSFLDLSGYVNTSKYVADVVNGTLPIDWTIQFRETNGLFWIPSLLYATGLLTILGIIGIIPHLGYIRKNTLGVFAVWSMGYLVFLGLTYLKFTRYAAPLLPFYSLFAARLITEIQKSFTGKLISYSIIGLHIIYGCMFLGIYATAHTSLTAASWISTNVTPSTVILTEEWNSIIRFSRPELSGRNYKIVSFNFYAPDTVVKQKNLDALLGQSDYILLESPKVKNTVTRLAADYPYTAAFYKKLESGALPFERIVRFTSFPRIGSIGFNDENAEETYTVFDHPTITIYKKVSSN